MATNVERLSKLVVQPRRVPAAVLRRIVPRSPRFGNQWVHLPDGSVTFRENGFVAADGPSTLLARHNFELRAIARELEGIHVERSLEVGCGFGRLSQAFASHSGQHMAVDINEDALNVARTTYSGVTFQSGSAGALPVDDGEIGLLVTWTVLQHIRPEMIEQAATEILRVLAPGATVLMCEEIARPNVSSHHTWHRTGDEYERLFAPLTLLRHSRILEIDAVPGMEAPGDIMVFRVPS